MRRPSPLTVLRLAAAVWVARPLVGAARASRPGRPASSGAAPSVASATVTSPSGVGDRDITVVIAARDEADRLPSLLAALDGRHDVIVVDDGSTDATASVARHHHADVVIAGDRPPGWAGKTWALHRGVEAATGSWIVHLDADVRPTGDLPTEAVQAAQRLGADLLSVATRVVAPPAARWLHASVLAGLVYRFGGPGALVPGRELANGQVLVARRSTLTGGDGWRAVADHVTEDVALARHLASTGARVVMIDGPAEIGFGSIGEVARGWGRSVGLPGVEPRWRSLVDVAALALMMPLPFVRLIARRADLLDAVALAARWGTAVGVARAYRPAGSAVVMSPFADPVAIAIVARSALSRSVTWRGRRLPVPLVPPGRNAARRRS